MIRFRRHRRSYKPVGNAEIKRYLGQHHPEILSELRAIIAATSLDQVNTP